jgi:chaperone required for assembly of F1-ATPase
MTRRTIARFYKEVSTAAQDGGFAVLLDGKPVKTPGRAPLSLPTAAIAEAVAEEWRAQGEQIEPASMPLTGLAHAAFDLVPRHRGKVIEHILGFGRSDLVCYRAEAPSELAVRQERLWNPWLAWIAGAHGVRLQTGAGLSFIEQPVDSALALEKLVCALGDFQLAALDRAASLTGSIVLGLAMLDRRLGAADAFAAAHVDEEYQAETWGRDPASEARKAHLLAELAAAERVLHLLALREA